MNLIKRIKTYIEQNFSYDEVSTLGASKKKLECFGIFLIEAYQSLLRHQTITAASALAFKSIVAVVPLIFIGIAVASMLGTGEHENYVNSFISSIEAKIPDVPELKPLLEVIRGFASKAKEIVGLSFIVLFYVAYSLLSNIEKSFNSIWQVERRRRFINRVVAYLAAIVIVPIMMSFSVYLNTQVETATLKVAKSIEETKDDAYEMITSYLPWYDLSVKVTPKDDEISKTDKIEESEEVLEAKEGQSLIVKVVLGLLSLAFTSFAVTLLIVFMPYTPVKLIPAMVGGFCSGVVLELMKFGFAMYVNYAATNLTRLYGSSLLVLPLFLLWIWMVWTVILLGAEVAFNIQNYYDLVASSHLRRKGFNYRLYLAVRVVFYICDSFYKGNVASNTIDTVARAYAVPPLAIRNIVTKLLDHEIIREVKVGNDAYSPGKDIAHLAILDVYTAINDIEFDVPEGVTEEDSIHDSVAKVLRGVGKEVDGRLGEVSFLDLVKCAELQEKI